MTPDWLPFALLGVSIACVWLPSVRGRQYKVPAFAPPFFAAVAAGLAAGVLLPIALVSLALLGAAAWCSVTSRSLTVRGASTLVAAVVALAMALHVAPGFLNPRLVSNVRLSADSIPFTQYLNFDKGAAGLILLAAYGRRVQSAADLWSVLRRSALLSLGTVLAVMALSIALGYVRPDFKAPPFAAAFLAANLFFTCAAEEAFFRGLLQERLTETSVGRQRRWAPVVISAAVFGLAHNAGGSAYVAVATAAGVGYGLAYAWTRRVEAPILVHFLVNLTHFLAFSYPSLQE